MLFAARDDSARPFVAERVPSLRVAGLSAADAGALIDAHAGRPIAPAVRRRLVAGTLGNPLALIELLRALSEGQLDGRLPLPEPLPLELRRHLGTGSRSCA